MTRRATAESAPAPGDLEEFFHPKAVALVGSVNRNAKPERLRAAHRERWGDRWYLVNAKGGSVGDIPIYEHVTDIPAEITLAVINVGTRLVAKVVEECGKHGVPYVLIFTAGFSEVGEAGAALEREVGEVARRYGIRIFGPEHQHQRLRGPSRAAHAARGPHRARDPERAPGPPPGAGD